MQMYYIGAQRSRMRTRLRSHKIYMCANLINTNCVRRHACTQAHTHTRVHPCQCLRARVCLAYLPDRSWIIRGVCKPRACYKRVRRRERVRWSNVTNCMHVKLITVLQILCVHVCCGACVRGCDAMSYGHVEWWPECPGRQCLCECNRLSDVDIEMFGKWGEHAQWCQSRQRCAELLDGRRCGVVTEIANSANQCIIMTTACG